MQFGLYNQHFSWVPSIPCSCHPLAPFRAFPPISRQGNFLLFILSQPCWPSGPYSPTLPVSC